MRRQSCAFAAICFGARTHPYREPTWFVPHVKIEKKSTIELTMIGYVLDASVLVEISVNGNFA